jgi:hypothetical protein
MLVPVSDSDSPGDIRMMRERRKPRSPLINGGGGALVEYSCPRLCTITVRFPAPSARRRVMPYRTQPKAQRLYCLAFVAPLQLQPLVNGAYTRNDPVVAQCHPNTSRRLLEVEHLPYRGDCSRSEAPRVRRQGQDRRQVG